MSSKKHGVEDHDNFCIAMGIPLETGCIDTELLWQLHRIKEWWKKDYRRKFAPYPFLDRRNYIMQIVCGTNKRQKIWVKCMFNFSGKKIREEK